LRQTCVALRADRTAELPAARPKKAVPTRYAHMLVALSAGEVLVEKRPPTGIWGGLWSLPQYDDDHALQTAAERLGARQIDAWPERKHAFTHYTLRFTPHLAQVPTRAQSVQSPGLMWLPLSDRAGAALPTPVRRLLDDLAAQQP
jgi:A/G-specific adenine glycosylase